MWTRIKRATCIVFCGILSLHFMLSNMSKREALFVGAPVHCLRRNAVDSCTFRMHCDVSQLGPPNNLCPDVMAPQSFAITKLFLPIICSFVWNCGKRPSVLQKSWNGIVRASHATLKAREVAFSNRNGLQLHLLSTEHQSGGAHKEIEECSAEALNAIWALKLGS